MENLHLVWKLVKKKTMPENVGSRGEFTLLQAYTTYATKQMLLLSVITDAFLFNEF